MSNANAIAETGDVATTVAGSGERGTDSAARLAEVTKVPYRRRWWLMVGSLVLADVLMVVGAIFAAVLLRWLHWRFNLEMYWGLLPVVVGFVVVYAWSGLYPGVPLSPARELRRLTLASSVVFLGLGTATFLVREEMTYSRGALLLGWLFALVLVPMGRYAMRGVLSRWGWWGLPVVVVGAGKVGRSLVHVLRAQPEMGLTPVAVLDEGSDRTEEHGVPVLRRFDLDRALSEAGVRHAIVAMGDLQERRATRLLNRYSQRFRHLIVVPSMAGTATLWATPTEVGGHLGIAVQQRLLDPGRRSLKRGIETALVLAAAPVLVPVMLAIALWVKLDSPGPLFYWATRIGQRRQRFKMLKFRSMYTDADDRLAEVLESSPELREEWEVNGKMRDDPRVTRAGRLLRRTSLDELPQLIHVLTGRMSLVGPRPILVDQLASYGKQFALVGRVRPGITGFWQVSGRSELTMDERVEMDCYYVQNWSVWLDVYLLARTVLTVVLCRGAY
ncbi:MAG: undecaprenyl-phosphate galactose phosphotransferase WbaP [Planctomycetota bacterium]